MKKLFAIGIIVLLIGTATACSTSEETSSGPGSQRNENSGVAESGTSNVPENNISTEPGQSSDVPTMDDEQKELCNKYLKPLAYSNFFFGNYYSKTLQAEWGDSGIITIYQDLAGSEVWPKLVNDQFQVSAFEVEGLLMRYFPFDTQTIQSLAGSSYDPDAAAYTMIERGGGRRDVVVTGSTEEDNNILTINYDLYGPGDADTMAKVASGCLQVQLLEDGQFNYVNNEIGFSQ